MAAISRYTHLAQTSFEFRKGRAFPVVSGIVVAENNEDIILEVGARSRLFLLANWLTCVVARLKAYWEAEHAAAQKEQEKRQQAVLNRWTKLVQGLRIRQRMREQYGDGAHGSGASGVGGVGSSPAVASGNDHDHDGRDYEGGVQPATAGGFLTGVEDVIQPYSLPRPTHVVFSSPPRSPNSNGSSPPTLAGPAATAPNTLLAPSSPATANDDDGDDDDDDDDEAGEECGQEAIEDVEEMEIDNMSGLELENARGQSTLRVRRMPKSMAALAAEAEAKAQATTAVDVAIAPHRSEEREEGTSAASRTSRTATRATPRTNAKTKKETKKETGAGKSSRKRARAQKDDDDDDEAVLGGGSGSESGSDGEEHVNGGRPRVAKRARKHRQGSLAEANGGLLVPVPPSDRVLRTRKGKSPALLAQEREQELAVQRALTG